MAAAKMLAAMETRLWHPFANMAQVRETELVIERGEDVWVWDDRGNRYLDACASLWYANVGHGRREIEEAVSAQLRKLESYATYGDLANGPSNQLASRLAALSPLDDARIYLGLGGADAIDTAAKLARLYWSETGNPERVHLIGRTRAYHGSHGIGTSIGGIPVNASGFGPLVGETSIVDWSSPDALAAEIDAVGAERVAAFFMEPVIGAGGVYPPPGGYVEAVAEICERTGVLLIVDSVICGFGRLGTWFGIERWDVSPDLIVFAKGVTSGYLPLGGVVVSGRVSEPFWSGDGRIFRHGQTYSGHPACCAAALANLDILEREELVARGRELEQPLFDALQPLASSPAVAEVRGGTGFLAAVELDAELVRERPAAVSELALEARRRGVIVRPLASGVAVSPPLTADESHLDLLAEALAEGVDTFEAAVARVQRA
jgi:adenosylmethionine-8-amino-7-oxononanoate aminotransferase